MASSENQNPKVCICPCALGQFPLRTFIFNTPSLPSDSPLTSWTLVWFHFFLLVILSSSFLLKNVPILIIPYSLLVKHLEQNTSVCTNDSECDLFLFISFRELPLKQFNVLQLVKSNLGLSWWSSG